MSIPEIKINLDQAPSQRWAPMGHFAAQARQLCWSYLKEYGDLALYAKELKLHSSIFLKRRHLEDVEALSRIVHLPPDQLLVSNLYYDLLKFVFSGSALLGCTAFAIDSDQGPIHARNLDWWSEDGLLRNATVICDYEKGGTTIFKAVSWPGYAAVLSGVAPGRFAITLNAVLSEEKAKIARSISFLMREVFEEASDFEAAVNRLSSAQISADCLLLVTGTRKGEMCVIERTPRRSGIREPESDHIIVTNDYRKLRDAGVDRGSDLDLTTCGRFERVETLLRESRPHSFNEFFRILKDQELCVDITMQHMVMSAAQNRLEVRLPNKRV